MLMLPEFSDDSASYYLNIDFGIIPILLQNHHGWDVAIASERRATAPSLPATAYGSGKFDSLVFLWQHAHEVDILQLLHFTWRSGARALLYKLRNVRGVSYVKLDLGDPAMRELERLAARPIWRLLFSLFLSAIDLISVESTEMQARFRAFMARCGHRDAPPILIIPSCGFDVEEVLEHVRSPQHIRAGASSTDILYVGRIGAWQKATEILLEAFRILSEDIGAVARLTLIGSVDAGFDDMLKEWRQNASANTASRLSVSPPILDRTALMDRYLSAHVFVISSRYEGIPNSLMEAAGCGCLIVSTPVGQAPDVLRAGITGWMAPVDDAQALAQALAHALSAPDGPDERIRRISRFASTYSWRQTIARLASALLVIRENNATRRSRALFLRH